MHAGVTTYWHIHANMSNRVSGRHIRIYSKATEIDQQSLQATLFTLK